MSGLVSKGYSLDIIPVETVLDICKFLPALDLLNMSAAYPEIEQLLASTGSPWRIVHLPFPDPLLQCYPGWRKSYPPINVSSSASTSTSISPSYTSDASPERSAEEQGEGNNTTRSGMNILQDERFHVLSEPGYFDLPDIKGGEHDFQDENTAWIILDVLNKIPLQYVQHLSFDSPPCHLRVYPCKRICECERHQNDHSHEGHNHQCQSISESALQTAGDNVQNVQLPPLSQPLRDLFESGLVDFSRHIDLRSLSEVLVMENAGTSSISSSSDGNDGLVFACATGISNLSNPFNGDYSSSSFESQSNQIYETPQDHESIEEFHSHTNTLDQLDLQDVLMELDHIDGVDQLQNNLLNLAQVSELLPTEELDRSEEGEGRDEEQSAEEALEQLRQFSETQAAYQRARHLIRILTLNGLETLETLRAPWWPAARIYTIRQQLERWSFMIEQTQAASAVVPTSDTMECVVDEEPLPILAGSTHQGSLPAGTCIQSTFP
ncbi:hypothetical protein BGX26_005030 [Mortierella sp. AD094]|nr:hypothetical protein BGX26_005030 [Mortierella sp. AD094]